YVNTDSDDTELTVSDISFEFSLDTKSFVSEESTIRRFDTGGIAGYSDGSISLSRNQGTIGYPQVGYNVGGIAGRSDGHILKCTNSGSIFGRKDIGGIVGQAEPYITSNLSASTISTISSELYALEYSVNSLQAHADEAEADLNDRVYSLNDYIGSAKEAISSIDLDSFSEEKPDVSAIEFEVPESVDDLKERAESLRSEGRSRIDAAKDVDLRDAEQQVISSVTGLSDQARVLQQEVSGKVSSLVSDADQIAGSIASMQNTLNQAIYELEHPEEFVQDTSDNDPEEILLGKISSCTNEGDVSGALNTGGIAGTMGIEYTADPEDDVSEELDATTKQHYELKCILEGNVNHGTVSAVRNDVGGIVGKMDLGLVYRSESYGDVSSSSGDNVGGIVGSTASVVRNNWSKCRLSGAQAVGGIVGCGTEGTLSGGASLVDSNVSMAEIEHAEEFSGAISGTDSGTFTNNRFVSDSLNGINGASFAGRAEPVSYEELLETPDVPDEFKTFTLKFVANGEVLKEVSFSYGDSFTANDMPAIPKQDGMYAYYDRTDLTNLHNDTVVTAVYTADLTSLASDETRGSGRAVFYVKGRFEGEDSLHAAAEAQEREQVDVVKDSFRNAALSYLTSPGQGLAFDEIEQWHLEIPNDGAPSHEVRYLLPKTLTGAYQIYLKTNGNWERI
ncbi:MAG: hypothetical protein J6S26_05990, partial [Solobacterium sp.]|nr:hypothetical protein [Solobacterium sp.]